MKALVYRGNQTLELLHDYDEPQAGKGQVVVKISKTAICGTDIHKFNDIPENVEKFKGSIAISGHEATGWIYEVGLGVEGLKVGQRILVAGVFGCNSCNQCESGFNTACENGVSGLHWNNHGCNAEYVLVPAPNVILLPDAVNFETATVLTCAGGTAMTIVEETQIKKGQDLVIIGLGPVGLSLLILAKSMGIRVAGVETSNTRRKMAQELGLDCCIDPNERNPVQAIRNWSKNKGCDVVAECVGKTATRLQAIEMASNRGKIAIAGLGDEKVPLNIFERIIGNGGLTLIGIAATPIAYMKKLVSITAEKNLAFSKLITHHFKLEQAKEALHLMGQGNCGKIIFDIAQDFEHEQ